MPASFRSSISRRASSIGCTSPISSVELLSASRMLSPSRSLDLVTGERRNELVATHADVAVDPPDLQDDVVASERPDHAIAWW